MNAPLKVEPVVSEVSLESAQAKAMVSKTVKPAEGDHITTQSEELVGEQLLLAKPFCTVGVNISATIPTGKFQNVKVGVLLSVPCSHGEIDEVYEFAKNWCDVRLQDLTKDIEPVLV